jgi:hypothetical protein
MPQKHSLQLKSLNFLFCFFYFVVNNKEVKEGWGWTKPIVEHFLPSKSFFFLIERFQDCFDSSAGIFLSMH